MTIEASTPEEYISKVPDERRPIMSAIRDAVNANIPEGFEETMNYGMIGWVVPHSIYPSGYHVNPELPLPFMSLASQKAHMALYHSGIYADQELLQWFLTEYDKTDVKVKLNMGKSCIRFKKPAHVPLTLIEELSAKMSVEEWISIYEIAIKKSM